MPRCLGRTLFNKRCAHITREKSGYCFQHRFHESCPICVEDLDKTVDVLVCGHFAHKTCVKKWADTMQDEIIRDGHPALTIAKCPICRADQPDIRVRCATWLGSIELHSGAIWNLLRIIAHNDGWVSVQNIPIEIADQMPDAAIEERHLIANCVATQLWMRAHYEIPRHVRFTRLSEGVFMTIYGII